MRSSVYHPSKNEGEDTNPHRYTDRPDPFGDLEIESSLQPHLSSNVSPIKFCTLTALTGFLSQLFSPDIVWVLF